MNEIRVKPLSINDAWQGRRFKTPKYKRFAEEVGIRLLKHKKPKLGDSKLCIHYRFHISNMRSDVDNFIKAFQDVLFTWLGIDDSRIVRLTAEKIKCAKHKEKIEWTIEQVQ